jgi:hypothetical protein
MRSRGWIAASLLAGTWVALAGGVAEGQQSVPPAGSAIPLEWSSNLDFRAVAGGGALGGLDPGQTLYVEPPDAPGSPLPRDALDSAPALESGDEPDDQVDALANGADAGFDQVVANAAELFVSFRPDPPGPNNAAVFREFPSGGTQAVWYKPHLHAPNVVGVLLEEVDALELWGPIGVDDALFYSLNGDFTGTSVFVRVGGVSQPYLSQGQIALAVSPLFVTPPPAPDVDGLMVKDADGNSAWSSGDEVIFSLRSTTSVDGGEIVHWRNGSPATFLSHGGHAWDTAFVVAAAFGLPVGSEDVDALEAAPAGQVAAPATPMPVVGPAGALLLGAGLLAIGWLGLRRRAHAAAGAS